MAYCRECGSPMDETDTFCAHCGAEVAGPDQVDDHDAGESVERSDAAGRSADRSGAGGQSANRHAAGDRSTGRSRDDHQRSDTEPAGQATDEGLLQERKGGLSFATYYPTHRNWTPLMLSGLLVILSFLVVPIFLLLGYSYRVSRAAALGRHYPPEFDDWGGLLFDGLRMTAVFFLAGFVWFLAAIVPLIAADIVLGDGLRYQVVTWVLGVFLYYFLGLFLVAFVGSDSVIGAFTSGRVTSLLGSQYMFTSFLWAVLFYYLLSFMVGILVLTLVGWLWGIAYLVLAMSAFWGYVHYRAVQKGILDPPVDDEPAADLTAGHAAGQPTR